MTNFLNYSTLKRVEKSRSELKSKRTWRRTCAIDNRVKSQVMDGLLEVTELDVLKALVDDECGRMRQNMVQQFGGGQQFDENMLPKELFAEEAEKRVRLDPIVNVVVETESIEADADRVREKMRTTLSHEQPEQLINYYYSNEQALSQVQGLVLEEQVVATLLQKMTLETIEMSYEDAIQPPPPPRRKLRTMSQC